MGPAGQAQPAVLPDQGLQSREDNRKQELVLDQARQAVGILEEEARLERHLEEEGAGSQVRPRRSARLQARAGALLVLHTLEKGVQRQLAAVPAGWNEVCLYTDLEDNKQ